jgi:protocatechuate 3,4-dioxygenase beta subunit
MSIASRMTGLAGAAFLLVANSATAQMAPDCETSEDRGPAILEGTVVDGETNIPLQGANVSMHWIAAGQRKSEQRKTETDRTGTFRFCAAPSGVPITVRAGGSTTRGSASIRLAEGETGVVQLTSPAMYVPVSGRIIDHASGQPVEAAIIDLGFPALRNITQEDGAFTFDKVPPGFYPVNVQHLGYATIADSIAVDFGSRITITVRMAPAAIELEALEVVVRSQDLERRGFYERMDRGIGTFIARDDVENMHAMRGSDILRRVAGVQLVQRGNFPGLIAMGRGNCPFRYVIDGARLAALYSMDDMPPQWIEGIEIYKGPSQVPIEFNNFSADRNGACGVIVIWTRNRG